MISFFKYQDPLRFSMILIILVIIRLPALIYGYPLLLPELTWQLIGEKMSDGFILYRDIWTTTEPFSAVIYSLVDTLFGKSQFGLQFFSLILVFLQAVFFNFILSVNNLFPDRTYVPAVLYVIFSSLFIDFYTLSPPMLGMTFLILAMHFIFFQIRTSENDENIFYTGVLIAISSLFYFPFIVFILVAIISFLFFTGAVFRKYFLLITGFVFPFFVVGVYYFLRDGLDEFLYSFSHALFSDTELLVSGKTFGISSVIPAVVFLASLFVISSNSRYINYQYVGIRIFILWVILAAVTLWFTRSLTTFHVFVFVPALSFFGSHFFLLQKNKWIREVSFLTCVIVILWINYHSLYLFSRSEIPVGYEQMVVKPMQLTQRMNGKKLLVIGAERSYYKDNRLATPYLNWELAQRHFNDLNSYENVSSIYGNFSKDMPEVIIDQENKLPKLFHRLPKLAQEYRRQEGNNLYFRKGNEIK